MAQLTTILASTWTNGLFVIDDDEPTHELPNRSIRGLADDLDGGALACVDGHSLMQRSSQGEWRVLARSEYELSVTLALDNEIFVGTDDARVLILDKHGVLQQVDCFDSIAGRNSWFAGTFIVEGKEVGPPLGIRSLSGAPNGTLFANVHVGGIPRSADGGATWSPTIEVNLDAHEVHVDPNKANLVVAATAAGLVMSHDGGISWSTHTEGLHAPYCSAVTIAGQNIFVAASEHHFSPAGAIYCRSTKPGVEPLVKVAAGLPDWLDGITDSACIASKSEQLALTTAGGSLYVSSDAGNNWHKREAVVPGVSSVLLVG